jgi:hypothetical protein
MNRLGPAPAKHLHSGVEVFGIALENMATPWSVKAMVGCLNAILSALEITNCDLQNSNPFRSGRI